MDWTEILTALLAAVASICGSALVQSKSVAVLETKLTHVASEVEQMRRKLERQDTLGSRLDRVEWRLDTLEHTNLSEEKS